MAYSKVFRRSRNFFGESLFKLSIQSKKSSIKRVYEIKVPSWGSHNCLSSCFYSTVLHANKCHMQNTTSKPLKSYRNFVAYLSTEAINENYRVVVSNPEGSWTESAAVNISEKLSTEIATESDVVSISSSVTDISDAAASVSSNLLSVAEVVEPSLSSLGLAHWTPVGLLQMLLEYMHVTHHMPWWLAIVSATAVARILLIPLLIKTQRNAINMSNYMPKIQYLQTKFGEARRTGNSVEASKYASELMSFMKDNNIKPLRNAMFPLLQAPVFLSFFLGLRNMAKTPVESMKDGGIFWATDLTIPDPYYVLPLLSCATLYVILKIGAESGVKLENMKMAGYFVKALPFVALPFCINFPSAVLYYWCTNNLCTLIIVSILKLKPVRAYVKLPAQQPIDPRFKVSKKGFISGMKEAYQDQKVLAAVEERRRVDDIRFRKAGTGPIPRTYSYDPTKSRPSNIAAAAQKSILARERKT